MEISAFARSGRFFKGNLHTHSTRSDGARTPESVVSFYRAAGYDFIALTDHFLPKYGFPITDTRPLRRNDFTTLLGAELHAPATGRGELWHILAVGLPIDFAPTPEGETGPDLASRAAGAGAFIGIAHPQWYGLTAADAKTIATAHAVEVYNHGCAVEADRGDGWSLLEELLADGRRLLAYACDDAHFRAPDALGGWVMVKSESLEERELLAALLAGDFYSNQGPLIHEVSISGGMLKVATSPVSRIIAVGRGSPARQSHGLDLTEARLPLDGLGTGYVRVAVIDAAGKRAWTNPIWVD